MYIHCLGLNHTTAPLDLRDKLAFREDVIRSALARLGCGGGLPLVSEMIILSTCNRVEIYFASGEASMNPVEQFLSEIHDLPVEDFQAHLYRYTGEEVVDHLFRVTAGLDSLVLGEPQILGQVTHALELARGIGACGPLLTRLFQSAIHAGKRARTETAISRNPASVSSLAASLAEREFKRLPLAQILVLGAGEMAELAVEALRKRGAERIVVVNRTLERAQALARRWDAVASTFEHMQDLLQEADIVISSTSAPHTIIQAELMAGLMAARAQRTMVMIDIAVPRDIDSEVSQIPGIKLFDIDQLDGQVKHLLTERSAEVPGVEAILAEEEAKFIDFLSAQDMLPLINDLHQQAEAIRLQELGKTLRRLPDLTDAERVRIDKLTRSIVKKLLDTPIHRLRTEANCPHAPEYATVTRTLFDLPSLQGACAFAGQECSQSPLPRRTTSPATREKIEIP